MNTNTATREELLRWIAQNASEENLEEWAETHLSFGYSMSELREMAQQIIEYGQVIP